MLSIFICDDDPGFLAQVEKCVENRILMDDFLMKVACAATNPHDIIDYLQKNTDIAGLYFLDLDLSCEINGIDLAEQIRTYDPRGFIVFITSSGDSYKLTFERKVEAMDYIVKGDDDTENRINECISNAQQKLMAAATPLQAKFTFKATRGDTKGHIISIDYDKIMYFEVSVEAKHNIVLYTAVSRYEFRASLGKIEKLLDKKRFYKCQRRFVFNLENIQTLDAEQSLITFSNGLVLEISAKPMSILRRKLEAWRKRQARWL